MLGTARLEGELSKICVVSMDPMITYFHPTASSTVETVRASALQYSDPVMTSEVLRFVTSFHDTRCSCQPSTSVLKKIAYYDLACY